MSEWWEYENLTSGEPYDWSPANRGDSEWDSIDFHLDLGCGKLKKARLGIDRFYAPCVDLLMNLDTLKVNPPVPHSQGVGDAELAVRRRAEPMVPKGGRLPFPDESIRGIVTHHCLEHLGDGFLPLMDEMHRVLASGEVLRIIVPLFPSRAAVEDPDHKRYFMAGTFETFEGADDGSHWHESFSVPYTNCRFELVDKDITPRAQDKKPPVDAWGDDDVREIRVALRKR